MSIDYSILEDRLGYKFRNRQGLVEALTHPSFAYEQNLETVDNQRLEFLGDAVLQLIVTEYLFAAIPEAPEGAMTKIRAGLVCEETLTRLALTLELGGYLRLGHGETLSGGAANPSNLSDAMEAVLGAIYLDGGMERAREVMTGLLDPYFEPAIGGSLTYDYKSRLFEWAQAGQDREIKFLVETTSGPEHDRHYQVGLYLNDRLQVTGEGRTKKAAEQDASRLFLETMIGEEQTRC